VPTAWNLEQELQYSRFSRGEENGLALPLEGSEGWIKPEITAEKTGRVRYQFVSYVARAGSNQRSLRRRMREGKGMIVEARLEGPMVARSCASSMSTSFYED